MRNQEIVRHLKDNPKLSIYALALKLGETTYAVGAAQHAHMAIALANTRKSSPLWDMPSYGKDARPMFSDPELTKARDRIHSGENGVVEILVARYRISKEYLAELNKINKKHLDSLKGSK